MARPSYPLEHYAGRLGWAIGHIDAHLTEPLRLATLAEHAAFSPYHFHRLLSDWLGETPQSYIRRCRLERSAAMLRYAKRVAVGRVAELSGFSSVEAFNRAFRNHFGMPPGAWRSAGQWMEAATALPSDWHGVEQLVSLRELPPRRVVYLRKCGPYEVGSAALWAQLLAVTEVLGVERPVYLGIGLDDPAVTPASQCRYDACLVLPPELATPPHLPVKLVAGGLHAVLSYDGATGSTTTHWRWLLQHWLVNSAYSVSKHPCFERFTSGAPVAPSVRSELCLPLVWTLH
jgi:AraC family transcriptional regulator